MSLGHYPGLRKFVGSPDGGVQVATKEYVDEALTTDKALIQSENERLKLVEERLTKAEGGLQVLQSEMANTIKTDEAQSRAINTLTVQEMNTEQKAAHADSRGGCIIC